MLRNFLIWRCHVHTDCEYSSFLRIRDRLWRNKSLAQGVSWYISGRHHRGPQPADVGEEALTRKPLAASGYVHYRYDQHRLAHLRQCDILAEPWGVWSIRASPSAHLLHVLYDYNRLWDHVQVLLRLDSRGTLATNPHPDISTSKSRQLAGSCPLAFEEATERKVQSRRVVTRLEQRMYHLLRWLRGRRQDSDIALQQRAHVSSRMHREMAQVK